MAQMTNGKPRGDTPTGIAIPPEALAQLGGGRLAYMRPMTPQEAAPLFPKASELAPDLPLWALIAADGSPIVLGDDRSAVAQHALAHDLVPVSVH